MSDPMIFSPQKVFELTEPIPATDRLISYLHLWNVACEGDGAWRSQSKGFWEDKTNQRNFMDFLAKELQLEKHNDWYKIKAKEICDYGGRTLLCKYNHSRSRLLKELYPDHHVY